MPFRFSYGLKLIKIQLQQYTVRRRGRWGSQTSLKDRFEKCKFNVIKNVVLYKENYVKI